MPVVQVVHPSGYTSERAYAARVLLGDFLGLEASVSEGRVSEWELHVDGRTARIPDVLFRTPEAEWLTAASLPSTADLYGDDLFGSAFFMLTRYEEAVLREQDQHGRFPAEAALATRAGFLDRPVVNELAERLWAHLLEIAPRLERRQRAFRVVPSHDVDEPYATIRQRLSALRRGGPRGALPHNPFDTFDLLMDASERRSLRAAFFFIAEDAPYSLDEPRIRRLLRRIHSRGHEIGFHASYGAFGDPARTRREFERLRAVCEREGIHQDAWGGRQHFLRWEPATWRSWDDAGLDYDSTLTFSSRPGFRAGACYEYRAFDLLAGRELRLRERPLVLMDAPTLAGLGLPQQELIQAIERLREQCRRFQGDFTVLWHNSWLLTGSQRHLLRAALGS